jgi:hypothetical protein
LITFVVEIADALSDEVEVRLDGRDGGDGCCLAAAAALVVVVVVVGGGGGVELVVSDRFDGARSLCDHRLLFKLELFKLVLLVEIEETNEMVLCRSSVNMDTTERPELLTREQVTLDMDVCTEHSSSVKEREIMILMEDAALICRSCCYCCCLLLYV